MNIQLRSLRGAVRCFSRRRCTLALILGAALPNSGSVASAGPDTRPRVYLCPDDHSDYFWTADDAAYRTAFGSMIDYYLDLADSTAGNPSDYRSRWHCDGSLWLWEYERTRTPAQFQRLIGAIRSGSISAPLNPLVVNNGASPAEAIIRGMYYPGRLERRNTLRFRVAISMENQTLPLGLVSLWAGSGAAYSWKGVCDCDTRVTGLSNRRHEIYQAKGLDGSGVLMKWHSIQDNQGSGGYAEARFPAAAVDYVTTNAPFNGFGARYPFRVIGLFGKGWDDFQTFTSEFVSVAQSATNSTRRVIVSNQTDFFEDFSAMYPPATLPSLALSFGNEWDVYAASIAEQTARVKRGTERLRTGEALAAIVSQFDPAFMNSRESARDQAFMDMGMFYEHDLGMVGPPTGQIGINKRIVWQRLLADRITAYADTLVTEAGAALGSRIPAPATSGDLARFFVFNPLSFARSEHADLIWSGPTPVHVLEAGNPQEVASQIVSIDGQTRLRILASQVPSLGYRVYRVLPGAGAAFPPAATSAPSASGILITHPAYRITTDNAGRITSLIDRAHADRELVRSVGGRLVNDLGPGMGTMQVESVGPVSLTLRAVVAPGGGGGAIARTTRITVYAGSDRIDLDNRIEQGFTTTERWACSFNIDQPLVRHEEIGAVLTARLENDPQTPGHYAASNARTEWLTLNHFADMRSATLPSQPGVTLSSADCTFFRLGASTPSTLDTTSPQLNILAGGRGFGDFGEGLPNQGGDTVFTQRFSLRASVGYDQPGAMRFALAHQNPLMTGAVTGSTPTLPPAGASFLTIDNPDVTAWAFKPAEDGARDPAGGLTLRLMNLAETPQTAIIQLFPLPVRGAASSTHIETIDAGSGPAPVVSGAGASATFARQQIRTFRLTQQCRADFNADGLRTPNDIFAFLNAYFAADFSADFDLGGTLTPSDIFAYLSAYFAGC